MASSAPCADSVGMPLRPGQEDVPWPCNPKQKYIVHFPEERAIWSFGSGYGGNALLGKKCFALRIASCMARDQGWLAEHMLILGVETPDGEDLHRGGFPECLRQDQLCHDDSSRAFQGLEGHHRWRRHRLDQDRAERPPLRDQPGKRLLRRGAGTSYRSNRNAMDTIKRNTIFTNVALTEDGGRLVGGHDREATGQAHRLDRSALDARLRPQGGTRQRPLHRAVRSAQRSTRNGRTPGVPISGFIFGGRRVIDRPAGFPGL